MRHNLIYQTVFHNSSMLFSEPVGKEWTELYKIKSSSGFSKTQCVMDCWNPWIQSHWVSWRCPPLFSSSCASCWSSCRALLSGRGWVCRTARLSQTAEPQWPCDETEQTHPAATLSLSTERSTRPDGHPRRSHQRHWPPKWEEFLSKLALPIVTSNCTYSTFTLQCVLKKDEILKPDLKKAVK